MKSVGWGVSAGSMDGGAESEDNGGSGCSKGDSADGGEDAINLGSC